jgi:hypothetical protein
LEQFCHAVTETNELLGVALQIKRDSRIVQSRESRPFQIDTRIREIYELFRFEANIRIPDSIPPREKLANDERALVLAGREHGRRAWKVHFRERERERESDTGLPPEIISLPWYSSLLSSPWP